MLFFNKYSYVLHNKYNSISNTHMRAYDAERLAKMANARRLWLTHFCPEEDIREYLMEAKEVFSNVDEALEGKKLVLKK